jgi:hypothetical protein
MKYHPAPDENQAVCDKKGPLVKHTSAIMLAAAENSIAEVVVEILLQAQAT